MTSPLKQCEKTQPHPSHHWHYDERVGDGSKYFFCAGKPTTGKTRAVISWD
jgi:hypothetical protein